MAISLFIPTALRAFTERKSLIDIDSVATVGDAIKKLVELYPAIGDYIFADNGELKRFINVFVGEENIKGLDGLNTVLKDGDSISLIPAIAGGKDA